MILYYIYRNLSRVKDSGNDKSNQFRQQVAIGAFILYIISEYIVLWFSRAREYHADRFAGTATNSPSALASALVKIAYGLAGKGKSEEEDDRSTNLEAIGAMRWDLWNPWAKWYELNSTHPLVANRLRYLSDQSVSMGQEPFIVFDEVQPESYWDEFAIDMIIHLLPLIVLVTVPLSETICQIYFGCLE